MFVLSSTIYLAAKVAINLRAFTKLATLNSMKLYLSSYGVGNESPKLQEMTGGNMRVAVICNAVDSLPEIERSERVTRELAAMGGLGFVSEEVDLRHYFGRPADLQDKLSAFGMIWIRGGNAFILRKAMHMSGFDGQIRGLLDKGAVYAGYSAAACVAGPSLRGIELCDDINLVPAGYPKETIWNGLGLIDYAVAPHYKSEHPESAMIDDVVAYYRKNNIPFQTLHDGEVIIIET